MAKFEYFNYINPPKITAKLIDRKYLLNDIFSNSLDPAIITLFAPCGYGKTVILSEHFSQQRAKRHPVTWLSLHQECNDSVVLLDRLLQALEPGLAESERESPEKLPADRSGQPRVSLGAVVGCALSMSQDGRLDFILDDIDRIHSNEARQILTNLISETAGHVRFILSGRNDAGLPLDRISARVGHLGFASVDLRMNEQEALALLPDLEALAGGREQASRYLEQFEGWPLALQLLAQKIKKKSNHIKIMDKLPLGRKVTELFFKNEVLRKLDREKYNIANDISIFKYFPLEIINYINDFEISYDDFHNYIKEIGFINELDGRPGWFEMHPLLAGHLSNQLRAMCPERHEHLHRTASQWFSRLGHAAEAVELAISLGDGEFIGKITNECCDTLYKSGRLNLLLKATNLVPSKSLIAYNNLLFWASWSERSIYACPSGRYVYTQEINRKNHSSNLNVSNTSNSENHLKIIDLMYKGDMLPANLLCIELLSRASEIEPWLLMSLKSLEIYTRHHMFNFKSSIDQVDKLSIGVPHDTLRSGLVWLYCVDGLVRERCDNVFAARKSFRDARSISIDDHASIRMMATSLLARNLYETDELDESKQLCLEAESNFTFGLTDAYVCLAITRARFALIEGDRDLALSILSESAAFARDRGSELAHLCIASEKVRLLMQAGRFQDVKSSMEYDGIVLGSSGSSPQPRAASTTSDMIKAQLWARLAASEGKISSASRLLISWVQFCKKNDDLRSVCNLSIQLSQILMLNEGIERAMGVIYPIIGISHKIGIFRTFIDEGEYMHLILSNLFYSKRLLDDSENEFLRKILNKYEEVNGGHDKVRLDVESSLNGGVLTNREVEILKLVSQGIKTRYISDRLKITEGTVKWYMQQIFDKLNVRNREAAVLRARSLSLI